MRNGVGGDHGGGRPDPVAVDLGPMAVEEGIVNGPTDGAMRIEELAERSGVTATTIRLYQNKRILEPPEVVKRVGWYNGEHLTRLRQISRLQDEGFSLSGIARLRSAWQAGETLTSLLGEIQEEGDPELPGVEGDRPLEGDRLQRAIDLGLVERTADGQVIVLDESLVAAGRAMAGLTGLGIPPEVVIADWHRIADATDDLAPMLVDQLLAHVLPSEVVDGLREVRSLAVRAVAASMASSLALSGTERPGGDLS